MIFFSIVFIMSSAAYSGDNPEDEFIAGRIEFTGKSGKEGIAVISTPEKAYLLKKGVLLFTKKGRDRILLKIDDAEGKYLRCSLNNDTGNIVIKEGDELFYNSTVSGSTKYGDARKILIEHIKLYENFILKIESTEDTNIISEAVKKLSSELDKLIPEMKRIDNRYPELGKKDVPPPVELRDQTAMLEALEPRLKEAFFKVRMFISDDNVKKATEDLQKVLKKLHTEK